ncbi:MAG: Rnf-Nqr domain containing protein [Faecalibacterium sp.]
MMNVVLQDCMVFFAYAVMAIFAQNAVFARGLGVSRLVHLVEDESTSSNIFGAELFLVQLLSAPLAFYANRLLVPFAHRSLVRPFVYLLGVSLVIGLLYLVFSRFGKSNDNLWVQILPIAAFNAGVLGTLLIATKQEYTLVQSIAFGAGSGIGYIMAVGIVTEAQRKLRSRSVPDTFKGLPITLIYIGILSLAIYAFTGHTVTI